MVLIIIFALIGIIISIAGALYLHSKIRKVEEELATYHRLLELDTIPSDVSYLVEKFKAKREKDYSEQEERREQFPLQEEERKEECIKRQKGEHRVCMTCGSYLRYGVPTSCPIPEFTTVSCPSCKWSCNITRVLETDMCY